MEVPDYLRKQYPDPSVNFALQFQQAQGWKDVEEEKDELTDPAPKGKKPTTSKGKKADNDKKCGEIISFDMFRKK